LKRQTKFNVINSNSSVSMFVPMCGIMLNRMRPVCGGGAGRGLLAHTPQRLWLLNMSKMFRFLSSAAPLSIAL